MDPTRNEWALSALGKQPVAHPFPRARPVIQGAVANGCALAMCAALSEPPRLFPSWSDIAAASEEQANNLIRLESDVESPRNQGRR
jgi:hypothetical protein